MSRKFLTAIDLAKNELQNAVVQNLAGAPAGPVKGQIYYDSTGNVLYWWDGTVWQSAKGGLVFGSVVAEPTFGSASADGASTAAARADHKHGNPTHLSADHAAVTLNSLAAPTGSVNLNSQKIIGLATPTANTDAANKGYVDGVAQGLDAKQSVYLTSTAQLALTGAAGPSVDGVVLTSGDDGARILLKNQTNPAENGIYTFGYGVTTYTLTRATDADAWNELPSAYVFTEKGTVNADTGWVCTSDVIGGSLGTTAVTWTQFSGAGAYTAGAGLTQSGTTFNVGAGLGITVNADDVAANFSGTGAANTVARSDHTHASATTRYAVSVGGATSVVVNHALGTRDVQVQVYRVASPFDTVECDVERTDTANVTLRFSIAPAAGEYRAVVAA